MQERNTLVEIQCIWKTTNVEPVSRVRSFVFQKHHVLSRLIVQFRSRVQFLLNFQEKRDPSSHIIPGRVENDQHV